MCPDEDILDVHALYKSLNYAPPHSQFTVLASFYLTDSSTHSRKIISLATGTKCIPASKLSDRGELVHDSHAEVLARRAAVRWLLEEIERLSRGTHSGWIDPPSSDRHRFCLRQGVQLHLYVSTLPCMLPLSIIGLGPR